MRVCPTCFGLYGPDTSLCPTDGAETLHYTEALIGMSLGPYQVRSLISEGGMGVVYAGEHPALGRRVALKVLRPELSLRDAIVERFVQEARAVNTIGHKNIVSIYDFGRTPFGSFYYVMEFLDGQTLRDLLETTGPPALQRAQFIVEQVASALSAAHDKGFVHRDVKPENIMLCQRGTQEFVKLLDFGIAKLLTTSTGNTGQTGSALGTPQYMSPEQLDDTPVDHRTDIYSLGAVAYEVITGQVPFGGTRHAAVRQIQLTRTPPPPSVCRADLAIARSLDAAVLSAINLDPAARFATILDFNAAFRAGVEDTLCGRNVIRTPPGGRTRGMILALLALFLVGSAGFATWVLLRARSKASPLVVAVDAAVHGPDARPLAAGSAAAEVARALGAGDPALRERAVIYLGQLKRRSREPELRRLLEDDDPRVRRQAALALGNLGRVSRETVTALHRALDRYSRRVANPWLRIDVASGLALLQDPVGFGALKRELAAAKGMLRIKALEALAAARHPAGAELAKHVEGTLPETRFRRLGYLARLKHPTATSARRELKASLTRGTWEERIGAARALAPSEPEPARAALAQALENAPREMRAHAAIELGAHLKDARATVPLLQLLRSADERQGPAVVLGLGGFDDPRVRAALSRALAEGGPAVRLAAAAALLD